MGRRRQRVGPATARIIALPSGVRRVRGKAARPRRGEVTALSSRGAPSCPVRGLDRVHVGSRAGPVLGRSESRPCAARARPLPVTSRYAFLPLRIRMKGAEEKREQLHDGTCSTRISCSHRDKNRNRNRNRNPIRFLGGRTCDVMGSFERLVSL